MTESRGAQSEERDIKDSKAIRFFREYSGGLNDWQRKNYSDGKVLNVAMLNLFDTLQSGLYKDTVKRINAQSYKVSAQIYSYLKSEGYLAIAEERDIKIEVLI